MNTRRGRSGDALPTGPSKFTQADMEELDARLKGSAGYLKQRRRDLRKRESQGGPAQTALQTGGKVEVQEPLTIKSLSSATGLKTADIIKYLFTEKKAMATINSAIDADTAMEWPSNTASSSTSRSSKPPSRSSSRPSKSRRKSTCTAGPPW